VVPASRVGAVATPLALTVAVTLVPVLDGLAANVTAAPGTGLPSASVTLTDNGVANA
jgi:hypothetical protein